MRTQMQLTNSAATGFGWLVAQEQRLHRALQLIVLRRALRSAYLHFAAANPLLAESLFDEHFVRTRVAPLLARAFEHDETLRPEQIAEAWFAGVAAPNARRSAEALTTLREAAAELLRSLEHEQRQTPRLATLSEDDAVAAGLFAEAVRANSNLELDWLWLYAKMTGSYERSYCLQKALQINPASELVRELGRRERADTPAALIPSLEG